MNPFQISTSFNFNKELDELNSFVAKKQKIDNHLTKSKVKTYNKIPLSDKYFVDLQQRTTMFSELIKCQTIRDMYNKGIVELRNPFNICNVDDNIGIGRIGKKYRPYIVTNNQSIVVWQTYFGKFGTNYKRNVYITVIESPSQREQRKHSQTTIFYSINNINTMKCDINNSEKIIIENKKQLEILLDKNFPSKEDDLNMKSLLFSINSLKNYISFVEKQIDSLLKNIESILVAHNTQMFINAVKKGFSIDFNFTFNKVVKICHKHKLTYNLIINKNNVVNNFNDSNVVEDINKINDVEDINNVNDVDINDVEDIDDVDDVEDINDVENIDDVEDVEDVNDVDVNDIDDVEYVEDVEDIEDVENIYVVDVVGCQCC